MPAFRLIVDPQFAPKFSQYCGQFSTSEYSGLAVFKWQEDSINHSIEELKLEVIQAGHSCIYIEERPIDAVFFDMDSTAIAQETIVELAACAGKSEEVHRITEEAMAGKLNFTEALNERVASLKGLPISIYEDVFKRLHINPGLKEFSELANSKGMSLYLVSGGFIPFAKKISEALGFQAHHANHLDVKNETLVGTVSGTIVDGEEKARFLEATCQAKSISTNHTLVVGDGANDLNMMAAGGIAIGYHPKPVLIEKTDGVILNDHKVLMDIIN